MEGLNNLGSLLEIVARMAEIENNPDSLVVGTPSKGGETKVYGNFLRLDEFKRKIENQEKARLYDLELRRRAEAGDLTYDSVFPGDETDG